MKSDFIQEAVYDTLNQSPEYNTPQLVALNKATMAMEAAIEAVVTDPRYTKSSPESICEAVQEFLAYFGDTVRMMTESNNAGMEA